MVLKKVPKNYVYLFFRFFFLILVFSVSKTVLGVFFIYLFIFRSFFLEKPIFYNDDFERQNQFNADGKNKWN